MKFESPIFHPNSQSETPVPFHLHSAITPVLQYICLPTSSDVAAPLLSPHPFPLLSTGQLKTKHHPPTVYPNGEVCISILHPPEEDKFGYESASERWSPVQTPETILLSVISMLSSPNDESPANVEAARMWREDPKEFRKKCRANVRASLGDD